AGGADAKSPHDDFYFFKGTKLEAVRMGPWKMHLAETVNGKDAGETLYNLESDIGESKNVASANPEVVKKIHQLVKAIDSDLGVNKNGPGVRPYGMHKDPQPLISRDGKIREGFEK